MAWAPRDGQLEGLQSPQGVSGDRPKGWRDHVFLTKDKLSIRHRSIELLASKHLAEAGIRDAPVHTLRHTFAAHSAIKGTSLRVIQEILGHADLKTISIYVGLARVEMDRQLQENALENAASVIVEENVEARL